MTEHDLPGSLLRALLGMSRSCEIIDIYSISRRLGSDPGRTRRALNALAEAGLVDAERLRLTLTGLAAACALGGRGSSARGRRAASRRPLAEVVDISCGRRLRGRRSRNAA
jgi:hypothetical protein